MKVPYLYLLIFSSLLFSCKKNDTSTTLTTTSVTTTVSTGNWRVTYYWDTDHEETTNFNGYNFVFNSNGTITATKATSTINGTWSTLNMARAPSPVRPTVVTSPLG